jgi:hypothetical protein
LITCLDHVSVDSYGAAIVSSINSFAIDEAKHYYDCKRTELDRYTAELRDRISDESTRQREPGVSLALGKSLLECYCLFGDLHVLDESIAILEDLLANFIGCDKHPEYEDALDILGEARCARFEHATQNRDIAESISLHQRSLDLRRIHGLPLYPSLHGLAVSTFVKTYGDRDILRPSFLVEHLESFEEASRLLTESLDGLLPCDPRRTKTLCYLQRVHREIGRRSNVDWPSYRAARDALILAPPGHPHHLLAVLAGARALSIPWGTCKGTLPRYQGTSYNECVQAVSYVSNLMAHIGHPHYGSSLSRLITWLSNSPDTHDFVDVLLQARRAYDVCPKQSIPIYNVSIALVAALGDAYLVTGDVGYVDEQIAVARTAVGESRRSGQYLFRPLVYNLAQGLYNRFKSGGLVDDLEESLSLLDQCLEPIIGSPRRGEMLYMHLAGTLRIVRYELSRDLTDLDIALELGRRCIPAVSESNPEVYISILALALELRYSHTRNIEHLQEAIELLRSRLPHLALYTVVFRLDILNSLSRCLCLLASAIQRPDFALEALTLREQAFQHIASNQPRLSEYIRGFAHEHACLWTLLKDRKHLSSCIRYFSEGASNLSIPPHSRLACAIEWSGACVDAGPEVRSEAFRCAVTLLPQVILFGDLHARLAALRQAPSIARDAAIHELARSRTDLAVELLEQGRAVFWNRALSSRQREDKLPSNVGGRLAEILRTIELEAKNEDSLLTRRKHLMQEYECLLEEARSTPGFEHLLRNRSLQELSAVARGGPVVVLLANDDSAIALIIRANKMPTQLVLPGVDSKILEDLSDALHISLDDERRSRLRYRNEHIKFRRRRTERLRKDKHGILPYQRVLELLWTMVVYPVIDSMGLKVTVSYIRVDIVRSSANDLDRAAGRASPLVVVSNWTVRIPSTSCCRIA